MAQAKSGENRPYRAPTEIDPASQLRDYSFFARLGILRGNPGTKMIPTSRPEANRAFELLFRNVRYGETADGTMGRVLGHQLQTSSPHPMAAVEKITAEYKAYAAQAKRDTGMLHVMGRELSDLQTDPAANLAQALKATPSYSGPGQFVRYLDMKRVTEVGENPFEFDPFAAKLRTSALTKKPGVIDPYTSGTITNDIAEHIDEVLGSMTVAQAEPLFIEAVEDQQSRAAFWGDRLAEVSSGVLGRPVGNLSLRHLMNDDI